MDRGYVCTLSTMVVKAKAAHIFHVGDSRIYRVAGHALERSILGAELTGGRALIVNAIDENAARFWRSWGFIPSPSDPYQLFRSLPDIRASLEAAGRLRPNAG